MLTKRLLILLLCSTQAYAQKLSPKVVYGKDDRIEVKEAKAIYQTLAQSTAARVPVSSLILEGETYKMDQTPYPLCKGERFFGQPAVADCSSFLVAEDIIMTAGHCIESTYDCQSYVWVFDYELGKIESGKINKENIYTCKEILSASQGDLDFGIVRLDRKVIGRSPLKLRQEGIIKNNEDLVVIGNPSGLPTKVSDNAKIVDNTNSINMIANLDTFGGNSGSAVFNPHTLEVEGILVAGATDYEIDFTNNCKKVHQCKQVDQVNLELECEGETVTRILATDIKLFLGQGGMREELMSELAQITEITPEQTIGFLNQLRISPALFNYQSIATQKTFLMLAIEKGFTDLAMNLIELDKMNLNLRDRNGDTALDYTFRSKNTVLSTQLMRKLVHLNRVNLNSQDEKGNTSLHKAVLYKSLDGVREILAYPFLNLNTKNKNLETPLHLSIYTGSELILNEFLTKSGVDINVTDRNKNNILHLSIMLSRNQLIPLILRDERIEAGVRNLQEHNALDLLTMNRLMKDAPAIATLLLKKASVSLGVSNQKNQTTLMLAAYLNRADLLPVFLQLGDFKINAVDSDQNHALIYAVKTNSLEAAKLLLENGADCKHRGENNLTAKKLAKNLHYKEMVQLIKKYDSIWK